MKGGCVAGGVWHLVNRYPVPAPRWNLLVDPDGNTVSSLGGLRLRRCVDLPDWGCLVVVYRGIREGVIAVTSSTSWWPVTPDGDVASWRIGRVDGTSCELIRIDVDGSTTTATWSPDSGLHHIADPDAECAWEASLVSWDAPGGQLEGMLATPHGTGPWPLVVYLHPSPWFGISAGDQGDAAYWTRRSVALFQPDYAGSGILGEEMMWEPLRGIGMPERDLDADGVLAGVHTLIHTGIADPRRLYVYGFSAGGYLTTGSSPGHIHSRPQRRGKEQSIPDTFQLTLWPFKSSGAAAHLKKTPIFGQQQRR